MTESKKYIFPDKKRAEALRKEHGEIYPIRVKNKQGESFCCLLKKPGMKELSMAMTKGKDKPLEFNKTIVINCWLEGDEEIKQDDYLYLGVCSIVGELVEIPEAEIVKI